MTAGPQDEHGDILRRALRAEAESVMPAPDGLDRIRARIEEKQGRGWFGWTWLSSGRIWLTGAWTRPALAAGLAAAVVLIGVSAPTTIDRITSAGDRSTAERERSSQTPGMSPGSPFRPGGSLPPPSGAGQPSTPGQPLPSPSDSPPTCLSDGQTVTATPSPGAPVLPSTPCPGPSTPDEPTPTPSGTPTPDPTPTDSHTPPSTPEPTASAGNDAGETTTTAS